MLTDIGALSRSALSADKTLEKWIVRSGLALDWPRYSKGKYASAQDEAERAGRGVWAGGYVVPWDYRACRWGGGRPAGCSER
jgi:endonuclease YncB( thermonuclease family)